MGRVGRTTTLLIVSLLPMPAGAVWGPYGGIARLEPEHAPAGAFDGFEAGILAFGPEGEGFWQAAFGRLDQDPGAARVTRVAARLNFAILASAAGVFYAGPAGARNWLTDPAGNRTVWSYGAQAGLLVSPGEMVRRLRPAAAGMPRDAGKI